MSKLITTKSLIEEYISIYGEDDFDYGQVKYINARTEVLIHCNKCNLTYPQIPRSHKKYRGCKGCRDKLIRERLGTSQTEYINFCKNKFGDSFDYSLVEYTSAHERIKIKCNKCNHILTPTAHEHKNSKGVCSNCETHDKESFLRNIKGIHKDGLYTYEKFEYKGFHEPSKILCHNCNEYFDQSPSGHLLGRGCRDCNSHYRHGIDAYKNRSATLYYFKVDNYYKIGITTTNVKKRYSNVKEYNSFENINEWFFQDGTVAYKLEKYFLKKFESMKAKNIKVLKKGGNTELFTDDILEEILTYMHNSNINSNTVLNDLLK